MTIPVPAASSRPRSWFADARTRMPRTLSSLTNRIFLAAALLVIVATGVTAAFVNSRVTAQAEVESAARARRVRRRRRSGRGRRSSRRSRCSPG
ncbi:MAG: hypothetical protein MZU84_04300 [Sphingobacterium sp.]|nr:hypothetical protein [Sphingobacterium sp.]